ncbi:MAG: hypothetical protein SO019_05640 [Lachnospiraceae bacterium]|nr:hypothetical protein [Lachnospiraceae bacterium]MDY3818518.1 hypothetical protein [Lachnospiraceae bacterium]
MAELIWLAIIIFAVVKAVNKSKEAKTRQTPIPNRPANYRQPVQNQRPAVTQQRPLTQARQTTQQRPVQQRPTQQRTTQQRPVQSTNSILEKAKKHAENQFSDDTGSVTGPSALGSIQTGDAIMVDKAKARHIHSEHENAHETELRNQPGVDDFDTYHLIDEINDLIVKGYSGSLEFERDFIAEGVEMLNRSLELDTHMRVS